MLISIFQSLMLSAPRTARGISRFWALLTLFFGLVASAQESPPAAAPAEEPMPLTSPARGSLSAIQDNWLQWDSAFQRGEEAGADVAVTDLMEAASELGMDRLPEVCFAVLTRATLSAADGNSPRARWALAMAERLDPGRPEIEFASAEVARHDRHYLAMIGHQLRGYARLGRLPLLWRLTAENLLVWALATVILSGTLFVALQLATHGASLIEDLAEVASRKLPIASAYLAALVVVILPVLVPSAWIVLPLYWAILLLPYSKSSERLVIGAVVLVLMVAPVLLAGQARRVAVELSPAMEATRSVEERRLYGGIINDVDALRRDLGSAPAALHLIADLHQDLGQVEYARLLYQRLIETEPLNVAAQNNIGAYYMRRRETSQAIDHLERAAAIDETRIEPHRNLWVLYRDYLAFEEAEKVLARVRAVAPDRVATWFNEGASSITVMRDGYDRAPEIRAALLAKETSTHPLDAGAPRVNGARLLAVGFFLTVASVIAVWLGRFGVTRRRGPRRRLDPPRPALLWIPGLLSMYEGRGWRAFFALLPPVALILLTRLTTLGYRLPWGYDPRSSAVWTLSVLSFAVYLGARWWAVRAGSNDVV